MKVRSIKAIGSSDIASAPRSSCATRKRIAATARWKSSTRIAPPPKKRASSGGIQVAAASPRRSAISAKVRTSSASKCRPVRSSFTISFAATSISKASCSTTSCCCAPMRIRRITSQLSSTTSTWRSRTLRAATITSRIRRSTSCCSARSAQKFRRSRTSR